MKHFVGANDKGESNRWMKAGGANIASIIHYL